MLLENKTAVITGCMQGIGQAVMDLFAREGADIFACCQCETEEFKEHIAALSAETGREIIPVYFDLRMTTPSGKVPIPFRKRRRRSIC